MHPSNEPSLLRERRLSPHTAHRSLPLPSQTPSRPLVRKKSEPWRAPVVVLPLTAHRDRHGRYHITVEGHGPTTFVRNLGTRTATCAVTGEVIPPLTEYLAPKTLDPALQGVRISIPGWEYLESRGA